MSYLGGTGTELNPWLVGDLPSFVLMTEELDNPNAYFRFVEKVDLLAATSLGGSLYNDGEGWEPKGTSLLKFKGHVDFNGFGFEGLQFTRMGTRHALWRYADGATFKDGEIGGTVQANNQQLAILIGNGVNCSFERIATKGTVTNTRGSGFVLLTGSLVGYGTDNIYTDCKNGATIDAQNGVRVGGLAGAAVHSLVEEQFFRCLNTGLILGETQDNTVNPLSGFSSNTLSSLHVNCFNDRESSGYSDADLANSGNRANGVTNLSTIEAQTLTTYTNAGWSMASLGAYVDETWAIDDGNEYPIHGWAVQAGSRITVNLAGTPLVHANVVIIECDDVNFLNNVIHEKGQTNSSGVFVGSLPIDSAKLYFWIAHKIEGGQPYSRSGFATQNLPS